jgi:putative isomerase
MKLSRREVVTGLAMAGAAPLAFPSSQRSPASEIALSVSDRQQAADRLLAYFRGTAPQLLRPAEGALKYSSIAPSLPGKQYSTSLWDWDTYWTTRGLFRFANLTGDSALHTKIGEHAIGSLKNFFEAQSSEGRIPIMIDVKHSDLFGSLQSAARNYRNQAKPVFGQLALLIADKTQSVDWLQPSFERLVRFYDSWILGNESSTGLLVWGDDVAIGNDNDPTTFGRPFFSSANLLLNCLFYQDLAAASELASRLHRTADQHRLTARAQNLAEQIRKHCWDPRDSFYYTVDVQCVDRRAELIPNISPGMAMSWQALPLRIQTFTGFLPLWCNVATHDQAVSLVRANYVADDRFRAPFGVRSLSSREAMYSMEFSSNPSNWLGPVWIIVNYFVWKGLTNSGFQQEADALRDKTIHLLAADLATNGSLNEYYHPDTGAALSHKGFMDWNMLVLEML